MSLSAVTQEGLSAISAAATLQDLEAVRVAWLGKNGKTAELMQQLGKLPPEERKAFGADVNILKNALQETLETRKELLESAALAERLKADAVDVTLPAIEPTIGKMHPLSAVMEELETILERLGFAPTIGTEVETDFFNFTALNIPEDHPARQDHDTFYLDATATAEGYRKLLRTQTSTVQIHTMRKHAAEHPDQPLRIMSIGRVFRCDSDVTHTPQFHQVEGLALDKGLHFGHLKGVLQRFLEEYFERSITIRLRPSYFPFTEPSAEVDIGCLFCGGDGCRICKHTGFLEVLGAGMVHRNVLTHGGIDPEQWQGFAFGVGIERLAMMKYGINDLRLFYESQQPFLRHFGFAPSQTV